MKASGGLCRIEVKTGNGWRSVVGSSLRSGGRLVYGVGGRGSVGVGEGGRGWGKLCSPSVGVRGGAGEIMGTDPGQSREQMRGGVRE